MNSKKISSPLALSLLLSCAILGQQENAKAEQRPVLNQCQAECWGVDLDAGTTWPIQVVKSWGYESEEDLLWELRSQCSSPNVLVRPRLASATFSSSESSTDVTESDHVYYWDAGFRRYWDYYWGHSSYWGYYPRYGGSRHHYGHRSTYARSRSSSIQVDFDEPNTGNSCHPVSNKVIDARERHIGG